MGPLRIAFNPNLRRRPGPNRDRLAVVHTKLDCVGLGVAVEDHDVIAGLEVALFDESQEARILIGHARHDQSHLLRGREEIGVIDLVEAAFR